MTLRYLFDTDHLSLLQRGHPMVRAHFALLPADAVGISIVTVEEQVRGRLAVLRQAPRQHDVARGYQRLYDVLLVVQAFPIILYDDGAATRFEQLRRAGIRIGTHDLRIATIALTRHLTLLTANQRDFQQIPDLHIEDWTRKF